MTRVDDVFQQLSHHQDAITSIQATQESHSTTLKNQQNNIADIKTSINHIIDSLSSLATKLNIQITLPPLLPLSSAPPTPTLVADASAPTPLSTTTTMGSKLLASPLPKPPTTTPTFTVVAPPITCLSRPPLQFPPPNILKPWSLHVLQLDESYEKERRSAFGDARNLFDKITKPTEFSPQLTNFDTSSSTVSIFYLNGLLDCTLIIGEKNVFIFDLGGFMKVAIKRGSPILDQTCPDVYSFGITPFEVLCVRQALDTMLPKKQEWTNEWTAHKLFGLMLEKNGRKDFEKVVFIFDPGGNAIDVMVSLRYGMLKKFDKCIFDLEDKVDLEGVRIDTNTTIPPVHEGSTTTHA